MSLLKQLKAEEDKKNKLFHEIIMASEMLQRNIKMSQTAETKEDQEKYINMALIDAEFIQRMALLANNGTYDK